MVGGEVPPDVPDQAARDAALDTTLSCIVEAPAGSGKTGLLIQRYLKLLATADDPAEVLALTFTRKATGEMRARILAALEAAANEEQSDNRAFEMQTRTFAKAVIQRDQERSWRLLDRPHRLNIRTFDALCSGIAHSVPLLSGSAALAQPLEDTEPLYSRAAHAVMLHLGGDDSRLNHAIVTFLQHRDGDMLRCEQVLSEMLGTREQWGRLVPLGKELDEDTLEFVVRPRLNASLQRAQCAALKRLHDCFPQNVLRRLASVAHDLSFAATYEDQPNAFAPCAQLGGSPGHAAEDLDHWLILTKLLLTKGGTWRKRWWSSELEVMLRKDHVAELRDLLDALQSNDQASHPNEILSLLKAVRNLPPAEYPADQWVLAKALFRLLQQALVELRLLFTQEDVCDFAEVALAARTALQSGELQVAMGTTLRHLLVDEMQDSSSSQYELLETLTEGWDGTEQTIFLVGDPKQSIYLFRQARVERFQQCMVQCKLGDVTLVPLRLSANFRSGRALVQQFNNTFEQVFAESHTNGEVTFTPADAVLPGTAADGITWHGTLFVPPADPVRKLHQRLAARRQEAAAIADIVERERQARASSSIAVLTRARSHVVEVARIFAERGIAYRAVDIDPLHERKEVLDILAITRALLNPGDRTAWLAVMRAPWCGLGLADLHALSGGDQHDLRKEPLRTKMRAHAHLLQHTMQVRVLQTLDVLDAALLHTGVEALAQRVERTWRSLGGDACTDTVGLENVRQFLRVLDSMTAKNEPVTQHTLERRLKRLYAKATSTQGAVDIMTIHKAKGLEWDVVLVPAMHNQGANDSQVALNWLEMPSVETDGSQDVLLAPLPEKGEAASTLYSFIWEVRTQRTHAELKRLLYVAATRARRALHLFAAPEADTDGQPKFPSGTLLKAAGPAAMHFEFGAESSPSEQENSDMPDEVVSLAAAVENSTQASEQRRPTLERLAAWYNPLEQLQTMGIHIPMPPDTTPQQLSQRPLGSFGARAVGNAIHSFVERLAAELQSAIVQGQQLVEASQDLLIKLTSWAPAIQAALRSGGLPTDEVQRATKTVLRALKNLLSSAEGRWILMPHPEAESEVAWRTGNGETIRRVRLDRSFFAGPLPLAPGKETLWIIDFKTGDRTASEQETFLQQEKQVYRAQLEEYGHLRASTLPAGTPIMLALSYPLMQRMVFWILEPERTTPEVSLRSDTERDTDAQRFQASQFSLF